MLRSNGEGIQRAEEHQWPSLLLLITLNAVIAATCQAGSHAAPHHVGAAAAASSVTRSISPAAPHCAGCHCCSSLSCWMTSLLLLIMLDAITAAPYQAGCCCRCSLAHWMLLLLLLIMLGCRFSLHWMQSLQLLIRLEAALLLLIMLNASTATLRHAGCRCCCSSSCWMPQMLLLLVNLAPLLLLLVTLDAVASLSLYCT